MNAIRGKFQDGRVVFDTPPDWPEGKELLVVNPDDEEKLVMMTDEEQGDDPASIAKWLMAFDAIPVAKISPFEESSVQAWRDQMRRHNIEAIRKQMEEPLE
jgi:hypothetical protein